MVDPNEVDKQPDNQPDNQGDEQKAPSELDKLKEAGPALGVDIGTALDEFKGVVVQDLLSVVDQMKDSMLDILSKQVGEVKESLGNQMNEQLEAVFSRNKDAIISGVADELGKRYAGGGGNTPEQGNDGAAPSFNLGSLLTSGNVEAVCQIINAFKQPSSENALRSHMNLLINGMNMGLKLRGVDPSVVGDIAKGIDQGIGQQKEQK